MFPILIPFRMFKLVHLYGLNTHKLITKVDTQPLYQILQQFHQQQKISHNFG
jgi:hypothetical protein